MERLVSLVDLFEKAPFPLGLIFCSSFLLWTILFGNYLYTRFTFQTYCNNRMQQWKQDRQNTNKNRLHFMHGAYRKNIEIQLAQSQLVIHALIKIMLLLGLLGTVLGMIAIFSNTSAIQAPDTMEIVSTYIAKAFLPTTVGLSVSLVGLYANTVFSHKKAYLANRLQNALDK